MVEWISGKVEYTEEEAASALGVSISDLRALVRAHVTKEDAELEAPILSFRPSDLLLLKMLSASQTHLTRSSADGV